MSPILGIWASQNYSRTPLNGFCSIATANGTGSSGTITFSNIPQVYKHLQIRGISRTTTATGDGDPYYIRLNSDSGNNYAWHMIQGYVGASSGVSASATTSTSNMYVGYTAGANNSANMYEASITDILDYANTSKYKTTRTLEGFDANNDGGGLRYYAMRLFSGLWQSTSAVTSITITAPNGNWTSATTFALYGIEG